MRRFSKHNATTPKTRWHSLPRSDPHGECTDVEHLAHAQYHLRRAGALRLSGLTEEEIKTRTTQNDETTIADSNDGDAPVLRFG